MWKLDFRFLPGRKRGRLRKEEHFLLEEGTG
jgi:hypothetical protein